jgi:hypothetical protein
MITTIQRPAIEQVDVRGPRFAAAFGIYLGCQIYPLAARLRRGAQA